MLTASTSPTAAWDSFLDRLRQCTPPQRPPADIDATVRRVLGPHVGEVLVLGVTPELFAVGASVTTVDWSETAIASTSCVDTPGRGIRGDWLRLPCADRAFSSAIGDGCLNCLEYPHGYCTLFDELTRAVRPRGRLALRVFTTPDDCESLSDTRAAVIAGGVGTVSGLKWRLANALCAERRTPNVPVRAIKDAFDELFPDRAALRRITGWSAADMASVDRLGRVPGTYSFPTVDELLNTLPASCTATLEASGTYELSERCPLLVVDLGR
jgi:hypothetical protein